jgi:hypothetical protein
LLLIYPPVLEGYSTIFSGAIAHHFRFSCPFFASTAGCTHLDAISVLLHPLSWDI